MNKIFTLNNGTKIETATRANNQSGYNGVAVSVTWTNDEFRPFIAACGHLNEEVRAQMRAPHRTSWHGGYYADPREAAYVVAMYKQDPIATDRAVSEDSIQFPADLYSLPITVDVEAMKAAAAKQPKKTKKFATIIKKQVFGRDAIIEKFTFQTIKGLGVKFGRDTVIREMDILSVEEFGGRYGI